MEKMIVTATGRKCEVSVKEAFDILVDCALEEDCFHSMRTPLSLFVTHEKGSVIFTHRMHAGLFREAFRTMHDNRHLGKNGMVESLKGCMPHQNKISLEKVVEGWLEDQIKV